MERLTNYQDIFAHHFAGPQPGFETLSDAIKLYYQINTAYTISPFNNIKTNNNNFNHFNSPRFTTHD
jgi:hypothetical protein